MKRRDMFRSAFAFIPLSLSFLGITGMGLSFITPKKDKNKKRRIYALNLNDLEIDETKKFKDLRGKDLILLRSGEREIKAMSTVCPHLGCTVHWQKDKKQFFCPCHAGVFDPNGKVVSGPPPRDLDSYTIDIEGDNVYIFSKDIV